VKLALSLIFLVSSTMALAISDKSIYRGYKYKTLKSVKVLSSKWLDANIEKVSRIYDFHENVSYIGEDPDEVAATCGLSDEETEELMNDTEVFVKIDTNKIVNKKGKTKGYIIYLFAELGGGCDVPRGVYVIDRKGQIIHDDALWESTGIGFSNFLRAEYIVNDPQSEF
jgi:hypothetical protein